eukprot:CAMPEP_0202864404 /NCGR_PEP_ID=MMETSP1391-20130828/4658_1 /ASSEMBLY_ACC=CAM_ASM_000867 /TAXON_ID=1034604 /ORGANISM="Chlamydomonas leiostraca, Strain SAG 11-49" /LENGTH=112 /DNA_ID=CAMNT_0049544137 /DNA_START=208 /DNA_END=546 /DNA_ORIENTATION=+
MPSMDASSQTVEWLVWDFRVLPPLALPAQGMQPQPLVLLLLELGLAPALCLALLGLSSFLAAAISPPALPCLCSVTPPAPAAVPAAAAGFAPSVAAPLAPPTTPAAAPAAPV